MTKPNNPMDEKLLEEQYEEIKIKLIMARFAELEGKMFREENERLRKDAYYLPSEKTSRTFIKKLHRRIMLRNFSRIFTRLIPIAYLRNAFITLLLIAALLIGTWNVETIRNHMLHMFIQFHQKYTEVRFEQASPSLENHYLLINWKSTYAPTQVPEGFQIVGVKDLQTMKVIEYENNANESILFQQNSGNMVMNVDTEHADQVEFRSIQGNQGLVIKKNNTLSLELYTENYQFLLIGPFKIYNELIDMAESVTLFN